MPRHCELERRLRTRSFPLSFDFVNTPTVATRVSQVHVCIYKKYSLAQQREAIVKPTTRRDLRSSVYFTEDEHPRVHCFRGDRWENPGAGCTRCALLQPAGLCICICRYIDIQPRTMALGKQLVAEKISYNWLLFFFSSSSILYLRPPRIGLM